MIKTNEEVIEYFFKDNSSRLCSNTVKSYSCSLKNFFNFINKSFYEVKRGDIKAWFAELDKRGYKPKTINIRLTAIQSFYKYCVEESLVSKNPALNIEMPKLPDSIPYYLEKPQLAILMEASKEDTRNRTIVATLYATGVRISELLSIEISDIDFDLRLIWIKKGKGNKERFVLFTVDCAERIKEYILNRNVQSPYLFCNNKGETLSISWATLMFRTYSKKIGFKVTAHTLRKTFATHLYQRGMPVLHIKELLGHELLKTTMDYIKLNDKARKVKYDSYQ